MSYWGYYCTNIFKHNILKTSWKQLCFFLNYRQSFIKRSLLVLKEFQCIQNFLWQDKNKKWPFNTSDCLWTGLTVCVLDTTFMIKTKELKMVYNFTNNHTHNSRCLNINSIWHNNNDRIINVITSWHTQLKMSQH
jgi:hypothetical protein